MSSINDRIAALRQALAQARLDAFVVLSSDPHQSEIVAPRYQSREWISGFTGSAGTAVLTPDHAGLWTDSRYFLQADIELADSEFELHRKQASYLHEYESWLRQHLPAGSRIGIDGHLISVRDADKLRLKLAAAGLELITDFDLIEEVWTDRPALPGRPVLDFPATYTGESRQRRIQRVRAEMQREGFGASLLIALDDIAWLLNLRGSDVDYNPLFYAYVLIGTGQVDLFISPGQIAPDLAATLTAEGIRMHPYSALSEYLAGYQASGPIQYDPQQASAHLAQGLAESSTAAAPSPVVPMKGIRNAVEIAHTRRAMEKDGVALLRLFRWLEAELAAGSKVTEVDVAEKLAGFRAEQPGYQGESFAAIAGYGPNGAIVHYRAQPETAATLQPEGIFLLDSGGQYLDGTTDVTRTVALGPPTAEQKRRFTLVLKGHIALGSVVFLPGTQGYQLDLLARQYLWQEGLNFGHGTGHGVGFYLNVHEGPQGIGPHPGGAAGVPFEVGMVTSNEPGYYEPGAYGIRIENLILVQPRPFPHTDHFMGFEDLTLYPMDWNLIEREMLTQKELQWLENYHAAVYRRLAPHLTEEERDWLQAKCAGD